MNPGKLEMFGFSTGVRKPTHAVNAGHADEGENVLTAVLRGSNYVSDKYLEQALELDRKTGRGIGQTLIDMRWNGRPLLTASKCAMLVVLPIPTEGEGIHGSG